MNRIKEVLDEKGIKQIWLAEKLGKNYLHLMNMQETKDNRVWKTYTKLQKS